MKRFARWMVLAALVAWGHCLAAAELNLNAPAVVAIKKSMQSRHGQLLPFYADGSIGLTSDGLIAMHDESRVALPKRQALQALIEAENQDRLSLYKEAAKGNNKPEWEQDIRDTFSQRFAEKAYAGWWVRDAQGAWKQK